MSLEIDPELVKKFAEEEAAKPKFGLPKFPEFKGEIPAKFKGRNFLDVWIDINSRSKAPTNYFRWVGVSLIATLLERNVYVPFAGNALYPNIYCLLVGESTSNKSTAMLEGKSALESIGYPNFTPNRIGIQDFPTSFSLRYKMRNLDNETKNSNILKNDILADILQQNDAPKEYRNSATITKSNDNSFRFLLQQELDALVNLENNARPNAIAAWASEFSEFIPTNSASMLYCLTDVYDTHIYNMYEFSIKNNDTVYYPCINIMGCITPSALAMKFDVKALESGFLTRVILVNAPAKQDYNDPLTQGFDPSDDNYVHSMLRSIRNIRGIYEVSPEARELCSRIDKHQPKINDIRLKEFSGRRYAHLLKISMVRAAGGLRKVISYDDVLWANTLLTFTELRMPDALGDFGTTDDLANKNAFIKILNTSDNGALETSELLKNVSLLRPQQSQNHLLKSMSDMIQAQTLIRREPSREGDDSLILLKDKTTTHLKHLEGDLINSSLIAEWEL